MVVDPDKNHVCVDGKPVRPQAFCYLMLNKPVGYLCTSRDPRKRDTFHTLLPSGLPRVFSIGRLDGDSEGLLLITNDGEWAHQIQHPRHALHKIYHVWTSALLTENNKRAILKGVLDRGETLRTLEVRLLREQKQGGHYEVTLGEGRNRHIRRMFAAVQCPVTRLRRIAIGPLRLGNLKAGATRALTSKEVKAFRGF